MLLPPLTFDDTSLLFAIEAIVLLITYELSSSYYGLTNLTVNRKKMRNVALIVSALFLITVAIKIIGILIYP
jgi:hypothetical protein